MMNNVAVINGASELSAPSQPLTLACTYSILRGNKHRTARIEAPYTHLDSWLHALMAVLNLHDEAGLEIRWRLHGFARRHFGNYTCTAHILLGKPALAVRLYQHCLLRVPHCARDPNRQLAFLCNTCSAWLPSLEAYALHQLSFLGCSEFCDSLYRLEHQQHVARPLPTPWITTTRPGAPSPAELEHTHHQDLVTQPEDVASLSSVIFTLKAMSQPRICANCKHWLASIHFCRIHKGYPQFCLARYPRTAVKPFPKLFPVSAPRLARVGVWSCMPTTPYQKFQLLARHVARFLAIRRFTFALHSTSLHALSDQTATPSVLPEEAILVVGHFLGVTSEPHLSCHNRPLLARSKVLKKLQYYIASAPWLVAI